MNERQRQQVALFRVSVLGPLISADLKHGDVRRLCQEQAALPWRLPDGRRVEPSWRTIESWYYDYREGGFEALKPQGRSDAGRNRVIAPAIAAKIVALKRENRRRSVRRIIDMLVRDKETDVREGELKKSTVHRLLNVRGLSKRPARSEQKERRPFRHAFAGDCWMADVMHGPQALDGAGAPHKAYLHVFLDSATRLITAVAFRFGERAVDFESVLRQGIVQRGVPRVLYVDNGAAQTAESLALICAELGVHLRHCAPYDAAAKGAVERVIRTIRDEVCDELPDEPMSLDELNARLWAWVARQYNRRQHGGTERVPLEHWLEQADRLRPPPPPARLRTIFLHRESRTVRNDHTIRYHGALLEVFGPSPGQQVELRFDPDICFDPSDPTTLPMVYDEDGEFVCDTIVARVVSNTQRRRRARKPSGDDETVEPTGIDPLQQVVDEQERASRPPSASTDSNPNNDEDK